MEADRRIQRPFSPLHSDDEDETDPIHIEDDDDDAMQDLACLPTRLEGDLSDSSHHPNHELGVSSGVESREERGIDPDKVKGPSEEQRATQSPLEDKEERERPAPTAFGESEMLRRTSPNARSI